MELAATGTGSAIRVFYGNDDFPAAPPPRCANWADRPFLVLVATAARFTHPGGIAGLRKRVAAISRLGGVRYWSTTRKIWRELFVEARALSSASPVAGRTDFHPTRIASGAVLFFWVNERSPIGEMVYRVRILQTEDHVLSFVMDNFLLPRRSKWIRAPVEGRIEAFHAGLDAAWGAERWKRGRYSRSGLA